MTSGQLNELYSAYCADPELGRDELLKAIRATALRVFAARRVSQPDDLAQDFTIDVASELPDLKIASKFSAWLHIRMRWAAGKFFRKQDSERVKVLDASGGSDLDLDEELSRLSAGTDSGDTTSQVDYGLLRDRPDLKVFLDLLEEGYSQTEIAKKLGMDRETVRRRLNSITDIVNASRATWLERRKKV